MSTNRGIFDGFPSQSSPSVDSPFAVASDQAEGAVKSPFAAAARQESPFTVIDDAQEAKQVEPGRPAKVPERRKVESPFQVAEPGEGFGFEAPSSPFAASPFDAAPAQATPAASPFSAAPQQAAASPFSAEPARGPSPATQAALAAFSGWQEPAAAPSAPQPPAQPQSAPAAFTPAQPAFVAQPAAPAAAQPAVVADSQSDSFSIRQLELRAIFGVDREMSVDEILQRSRALPGIRNISRVGQQDMATIEGIKNLLPNLGFGNGALKLYAGSVPLDFIREGQVVLAVQTDGGFAPGVRETLILVARELGRLG